MNRDDAPSIPDALSHRQLNQWLATAMQESSTPAEEGNDTLSAELERWANHTRFLLQRMAHEGDAIGSASITATGDGAWQFSHALDARACKL